MDYFKSTRRQGITKTDFSELGFDSKNPYKDEDDAKEIDGFNEIQRETILGERFAKAQAAEYKFRRQGEIAKMLSKQNQESEAKKPSTLGKRQRKQSISGESGEVEESDRSNSSSSSRSHEAGFSDDESFSDRGDKRVRERRQQKVEDKRRGRKHEFQVESSEDQSSGSSDYYDQRSEDRERKGKRGQEKNKVKLNTLIEKPLLLKDFQKICIRRRDLVRWIEHPDYQEGIRGGFVRVTYHRAYVIGQIERFKLGNETYRVDQKETKIIIELRNGDKLKDFKLNAISDQKCTQSELEKLQKDNKKLVLNYDFFNQIKQQFGEATKFQQDKDEVKKLLHKQNYDKIKAGNYKSLNLTDVKITLQGEIAMTEQAIQISIQDGAKLSDRNELYNKLEELKDMFSRVCDRIKLDSETAARCNKPTKVGANLKQQNELQEWLEKQHFLAKHRQEEGSNCFSYFRPKQLKQAIEEPTDAQHEHLLEVLRLKSQMSASGLQTETSSVQQKHLSYFDKIEGCKAKIKEAHKRAAQQSQIQSMMDLLAVVKTQDVRELSDGRQPAHPDWVAAKASFAQNADQVKIVSFDQY